jgi:hypothetical protein
LLEEERDSGADALIADIGDPGFLKRPGAGAGFADDDDPVDFRKLEVWKRTEKRFEGKKSSDGPEGVQERTSLKREAKVPLPLATD